MPQSIVQVDAFADRPFTGNPAAICVLTEPRESAWMQAVAMEMNLSETAYLLREADGWRLRWFTPAMEVDLCGHATLASAHVLWEDGHLTAGEIARFHTLSGLLTAEQVGGLIELNFPSEPPLETPAPPELARAIGLKPRWVGRNRLDWLAEVESEAAVRAMKPDFALVERFASRGLIVTAPATTPGLDFVSRFICPATGVLEDPVTGSAHCALGPYWSARLGKPDLVGYQASARGGTVRVRLLGDRVAISGQAITILRGELV